MSFKPSNSANRIAIIRPSALGDVCRTVPALVSLRRAWPEAQIRWIVQDTFVEAVSAHPDLSAVIPFPRARFSRIGRSPSATREWFAWTRSLKSHRFDLVFDLQGLARSGIMTWFTRAPRRIGFADARECAFLAYTTRHQVPADRHTVDRMLDLIEAQGVPPVPDMRLYVPLEAESDWSTRMTSLNLSKHSYAVIAPTSRWEGKRWPADRFADAATHLLEHGVERIVVVGAANERDQCKNFFTALQDSSQVIDLLGQTTVGQLMAVIANSRIVLANDSAALHMAVGLNRPYVALFGPTSINLVGPYGGERWVVQPPDVEPEITHKDTARASAIMRQITTSDVMARLSERLAQDDSQACPGSESLSPAQPSP